MSTPQFAYLLYKKVDNVSFQPHNLTAKRQFDGSPGSRRSFLSRFARSLFPIVIAFEFRAYTYSFISIYSNSIETACHEFKSYHLQRKWGGVVKHDGSFIQSPNFELGYAVCKVHRKIRHTINSGWQNAPPHFEPIQTCSESVPGL